MKRNANKYRIDPEGMQLPENIDRTMWIDGVTVLCKYRRVKLPSGTEWELLMAFWRPDDAAITGLDELLHLRGSERLH